MGTSSRSDVLSTENPGVELSNTGDAIRGLRKAKRMTIKDLAAATSLSIGHLSEIERGLAYPSIKALEDIAKALNATVSLFVRNAEQGVGISKTSSLPKLALPLVDLLAPPLKERLKRLLTYCTHQASGQELSTIPSGDEAGILLSGKLELCIGDQCFSLREGDSFCFPSATPHHFRNRGGTEIVAIWISAPPALA